MLHQVLANIVHHDRQQGWSKWGSNIEPVNDIAFKDAQPVIAVYAHFLRSQVPPVMASSRLSLASRRVWSRAAA